MSRARLTVWPPPARIPPERQRHLRLPFPLDREGCRLYGRARHGLWHWIRAVGIQPGDEALVPAYHHGSEVEALRRAGVVCRFYEGGPRLEPEEAELDTLMTGRTRMLHLIHYLGLPADSHRWRAWTARRGLLLVEDAAQAWLSMIGDQPVGAVGDLSIFSLYKTVGIPEGAAAMSRIPLPKAGEGVSLRSVATDARWLARRVTALQRLRRGKTYDPLEDFALGDPSAPASAISAYLVGRLSGDGVANQRKANYRKLQEALGDLVPSAFPPLSDGSCPFVFPIAVREKEDALRLLAASGIEAMNLWSVPHPTLPAERFPRAARLRRSVIGLPVHQGLTGRDVAFIARSVQQHSRP